MASGSQSSSAFLGTGTYSDGVGIPQERADYKAAERQSKLRPMVRGLPAQGASADWHTRQLHSQLYVGELGLEFDRNNPIGFRMLNCIVDNILQDVGFLLHPKTGDKKLDDELRHRCTEEMNSPEAIDIQGEYTFHQLSAFVLRSMFAAGDIFALFTSDGPIQLLEHHRCRNPRDATNLDIVGGVEMDKNRRRLRYWFTKEDISPLTGRDVLASDVTPVAAYNDFQGFRQPNVVHVRTPLRSTQTRGLSIFAPVFDYLAMHDDLQFLQLVKSQLANMFLLRYQRDLQFNAAQYANRLASGVETGNPRDPFRMLRELHPGASIQGAPGEQVDIVSPQIPNPEWFAHMKLVLRIVGLSFGLPYVLLMMDTADTTFHGYRGAVTEARGVFRRIQSHVAQSWHTPVYVNRLHRWCDADPTLRRLREESLRPGSRVSLFKHEWTKPGWDSVDPVSDSAAKLMDLSNSQNSPRRAARDQDTEWETLSEEIVDDRLSHADRGFKAARQLLQQNGLQVTDEALERWAIRLAPLSLPERTQLSLSLSQQQAAPTGGAKEGKDD